jgi:hypothetical protein
VRVVTITLDSFNWFSIVAFVNIEFPKTKMSGIERIETDTSSDVR